MRNLKCYAALPVFLSLILVLNTHHVNAQKKTLNRPFDQVTVLGVEYSGFSGVPVDEIFLFAYDSTAGVWGIIPFQIDERDTSGSLLGTDTEIGLDDDDEIVFMARDAGDRAPKSWIDNSSSQSSGRCETRISGDGEAWVYAYRIPTGAPPLNPTDYVDYTLPPNETAADTVSGQAYVIANAANGFPNSLSIQPSGGGTGVDILERQEISIDLTIPVLGDFSLNETDNFISTGVNFKDGNIRVVRELIMDIELFGLPVFTDVVLPVNYYGYSVEILADFFIPDSLDLNATITKVQQSFNLNSNAIGMSLFNVNNSNIAIDGVPDVIDSSVVLFPGGINRVLLTGPEGNCVYNFKIPELGDSQLLFYEDLADSNSYGNTGFVFSGSDIEGAAPLGLTILFPGSITPGQESDFTTTAINDLAIENSAQTFDEITSVEFQGPESNSPESFVLAQNFPNPFNPATVIQYQLPGSGLKTARAILKVYDLLGREVQTLVDKDHVPGSYEIRWDGTDKGGAKVSSGIYIYQLKFENFVSSKKMILLR